MSRKLLRGTDIISNLLHQVRRKLKKSTTSRAKPIILLKLVTFIPSFAKKRPLIAMGTYLTLDIFPTMAPLKRRRVPLNRLNSHVPRLRFIKCSIGNNDGVLGW